MTTTGRPYLPAMGQRRLLPFYDLFARLAGARAAQARLVAQAGIGPGDAVLEIGAGTGAVLLMARRAVPTARVTGLDPDAEALALARRRGAAAGVDLDLVVGYADRLPQADGSVDRVLSSLMLHHLPAEEKVAALAEAHRVLAPGGSVHVADIGGVEPGPIGRRLHRRHQHHQHHEHHGHDGHAAQHHDHAGPRPETVPAEQVVAMLTAAGFARAVVVGHRRTLVGPVTFYRAERD